MQSKQKYALLKQLEGQRSEEATWTATLSVSTSDLRHYQETQACVELGKYGLLLVVGLFEAE